MAGELAQKITARALASLNGVGPAEAPLPTLFRIPQVSSPSEHPPRFLGNDTSARTALSRNLELQAAFRQELTKVEKALVESREELRKAQDRLSRKKSVGIVTTSEKFVWSRGVDKFLAVNAHPLKLGKRKEIEKELRKEPIFWLAEDINNLRVQIAKLYPAAVEPDTASDALSSIDWHAVSKAVLEARRAAEKSGKLRARAHAQTAEEFRLRWTEHDMPGVADEQVPWSKEEDLAVIEAAESLGGRQWVKIAARVNECEPGSRRRTPIACLKRFQRTLNTRLYNRERWSEEEDKRMKEATETYGVHEWLRVSRAVGNRSPAQCYNRWIKKKRKPGTRLDLLQEGTEERFYPEEGRWTTSEERHLCLVVRALMNPPQSAVDEKETGVEEWVHGLPPVGRKHQRGPGRGSRSSKRAKTDGFVETIPDIDWLEVANLMSRNRSEHQCREKWIHTVDPSVNSSQLWSEAEDAKLLEVSRERKPGAWSKIEQDMANWAKKNGILRRSSQHCKRRFKVLQPDKYVEHCKYMHDRRMVEPRLNYNGSVKEMNRSEITFDDYELSGGSDEEDDEETCNDDEIDEMDENDLEEYNDE